MRRLLLLVLVGLLGIAGHQTLVPWPVARAQAPEAVRALVYGINAGVPGNFLGTFAPPATASIYLLADETSVISPRMTEIAFWPITNEYRANWSRLNEPVPGTLEITRNGAVVAELEPTDYTIHFTQTEQITSAELFLGEEAVAAEARFRERQAAFQQASDAYHQAERAWMDAVAAATLERQQGGAPAPVPPPPERPEPIGVFSNGLNQGFPIDLDPGQYGVRLRGEDGEIVPESERGLTIFAARRAGIGYTVVPETRWTTPLESPAPNDIIFGAAGSTLYLEPREAREYPAREWALLQNPQRSAATASGWEWVNGELLVEGRLETISGDRVVAETSLTPFQVQQLPGSQLGYEVIALEPDTDQSVSAPAAERVAFEAFPLRLEAAGERYQVRMISNEGDILPGSVRLVNAPAEPSLARLLLLPVVPLVIGAMAITGRQRRVKPPRGLVE